MSGKISRSLLRSEEYLCGRGFGRRETCKGDEAKWKGSPALTGGWMRFPVFFAFIDSLL